MNRRHVGTCGAIAVGIAVVVTDALPANAASEVFDCVIEPNMTVDVGSAAEGIVAEFEVKRGDAVKEGQVLARLDSEIQKARVALARARANDQTTLNAERTRLDLQEKRLERSRTLAQRNVISDTQWDQNQAEARLAKLNVEQAEMNLRIAALELDQAEKTLALRTIRSPVNGVVVERLLSPGEYVSEQAPLVTIARIDPLNVEVFVPTSHYPAFEVGMVGAVHLLEPIKKAHDATVTVIDRVFDAASGTFGVRLELPNPNHRIPAGLKCTVSFDVGADH